jgi:hypothetical protein
MAEHWFDLLQTASIVGSLLTATIAIRENTRQRKVETLFELTKSHRDLWSNLFDRPQFWRVLRDDLDLETTPPTGEEELFVHLLILHIRAAFKARKSGMQFDDDAFDADVRQLFSRPLVRHVWSGVKGFQDAGFVAFVDSSSHGQN